MMRPHSGPGRTFVTTGIAALAVVGMVGTGTMTTPATAQAKLQPVAAQAPLVSSSDSSTATDLFKSLAEGAAGEVGGAAAGWAMSAIGLSGHSDDQAEALASISDQLKTIINQLNELQSSISALTDAIKVLDCDSLSSQLLGDRQLIDALATQYQGFTDEASGAYGPATVPPQDKMTQWAADVTNETNGVGSAIDGISDLLLSSAAGQGIISACLQPSVIHPPIYGTLGDTDYYNKVANLINFYYDYQAEGLLLLQEAYHYQAQQSFVQAGGTPPPADDPGYICENATDSSTNFVCTLSIDQTNDLYQRLALQFELAGLPYTDDKVILLNNSGANPPLFVRSLEKFTQAAGDACPTPLTSADPCQSVTLATAGDTHSVGSPMKVNYDGYTTWTAATAGNLNLLLHDKGPSQTPAQYLNSNGFENAENKILLTPQTASFSISNGNFGKDGSLRCFLDTDVAAGVVCSSQSVASVLLQGGPDVRCVDNTGDPTIEPSWVTRSSLPTNRNNFYDARIAPQYYGCGAVLDPKPGWLVGNTSANSFQYRWPHFQVGSLTCTNGRSPINAGGVPTRCGKNFDTVFNTLVARPATCAGTTVGECGDTAYVAVTGPQAQVRAWSSPALSGDLRVARVRGVVRKITGTVKLSSTNGHGSASITFNIRLAGRKHTFYTGIVKIKADGRRLMVVPLRRIRLEHNADGSVFGHIVWHRHTLTWSVRDSSPALTA